MRGCVAENDSWWSWCVALHEVLILLFSFPMYNVSSVLNKTRSQFASYAVCQTMSLSAGRR